MKQSLFFAFFLTFSALFAQKQKGYPTQELTIYYHKAPPTPETVAVGAAILNALVGGIPLFKPPTQPVEKVIVLGEAKADVLRVLGEPSRRIKYSELEASFPSELLDWEALGIAFTYIDDQPNYWAALYLERNTVPNSQDFFVVGKQFPLKVGEPIPNALLNNYDYAKEKNRDKGENNYAWFIVAVNGKLSESSLIITTNIGGWFSREVIQRIMFTY